MKSKIVFHRASNCWHIGERMGTITISINDEVERRFREEVIKAKGNFKGSLGQAITEAILAWIETKKQDNLRKQALETLEVGFDMGKIKYVKREELHDR